MPILHDTTYLASLHSRVQALRPDAERKWGKMTVDQMLWHVNGGLELALGQLQAERIKPPLPAAIMRPMVLHLPWPKSAPTSPELVPKERFDFSAERKRCLELLDAVAARKIDGAWPQHPVFGTMRGQHWSQLMAKHMDHHLKQFGA